MTTTLFFVVMALSVIALICGLYEIVMAICKPDQRNAKTLIKTIASFITVLLGIIAICLTVPAPEITSVDEDGAPKLNMESDLPFCTIYYSLDGNPFEKYTEKVDVSAGNSVVAYSKLLWIFKSQTVSWNNTIPWRANVTINAKLDSNTATLIMQKVHNPSERNTPLFGTGDAEVKLDLGKNITVRSQGLLNTELIAEDMSGQAHGDFHDTTKSGESLVDISDIASSYFLSGDTKDCVMFSFTNLGVSVTLTKEGLRKCLESSDHVELSIIKPQGEHNALRFEISTETGGTQIPGGAVLRMTDFNGDVPIVMNGEYVSAMAYTKLGDTVTVRVDLSCQVTASDSKYGTLSEIDREATAMRFVSSRGIYIGDENGELVPENELTHGELIQSLYNLAGRPEVAEYSENAWYSRAEAWAREMNIMLTKNGAFDGQSSATWEQCVTALWQLMGEPEPSSEPENLGDAGLATSYARMAAAWAIENGIVPQDMLFHLGAHIRRVEFAEMILDLHPAMGNLLEWKSEV